MGKCYIIILNYKRWDEALACIASVFASEYPDFTVIVVDNDSGNQSLQHMLEGIEGPRDCLLLERGSLTREAVTGFPGLVLIQNDRNAGFAGGNNTALRMLLEEDAWVWLLNPDMSVEPGTLGELVRSARQERGAIIGAVTKSFQEPGKVLFYGGGKVNHWSATVSFATTVNQIPGIEYISGGSLFMHTSHLREVGLLPEDYFLYWEETEWCFRARRKGFGLRVCLAATCYDKGSTTIGRGFLSDYFYTRNGLLFLARHGKGYLPTAICMVFFRIGWKIASGELKRAKGVFFGLVDFLTGRRYEKTGRRYENK